MAERPRLDAVLFDAGGTLGRLDFEWMSEAVTSLGFTLDATTLRTAEIEGRRRYDESIGMPRPDAEPGEPAPPLGVVGDTHAYFRGMLVGAGVPSALIPVVLERWLERQKGPGLWSRLMEGAPEALAGVRALGLRRAVVSNSDGRAEQHVRDWGLIDAMEFIVDSQIVGIEKPDARIFGLALDRLALPADRVLYVGDIRCVDEVGSRAAGLHFVLIDPTGSQAPSSDAGAARATRDVTARYAAPGSASISSIALLPDWIAHHFTPPMPAPSVAGGPSRESRTAG